VIKTSTLLKYEHACSTPNLPGKYRSIVIAFTGNKMCRSCMYEYGLVICFWFKGNTCKENIELIIKGLVVTELFTV